MYPDNETKTGMVDIDATRKKALIDRIHNDFTYHAPKGDQREQSLALTYLGQSVMIANASIARNE